MQQMRHDSYDFIDENEDFCTVNSIMHHVTIRPHWMQCVSLLSPVLLLLIVVTILNMVLKFDVLRYIYYIVASAITIYLIYKVTWLLRMKYVITKEQILFVHGVFNYTTDYVELYRVFDYQQRRSIIQQLTGLKTVTIMANDRNTPELSIIGVKNNYDVVKIIRERVEYNKREKNIYEIGNRY